MTVPSADPGAVYRASFEELDCAIRAVLDSGIYIQGNECAAFEQEFAAWGGFPKAAGVASGTAALQLALAAVGVRPGDLVATVSHTAVATAAAIENVGARLLLVDIDPDTFTMSLEDLERTLGAHGDRVKAIVPVHLYGHPADMRGISKLAEERAIPLVEDCAQAHGASLHGRAVGDWGAAGAFSFYPTKNLPCFGDGGAVVGNRETVEQVARLREYGWGPERISLFPGTNGRLDEIQAAILRVNLHRVSEWNDRRRLIASRYQEQLVGLVELPRSSKGAVHVFHQFVIKSQARDDLRRSLRNRGIATAVHYPEPIHLQPAYKGRALLSPEGLVNTEQVSRMILSLPVHPHLQDEEVDAVIEAVRDWCNSRP